MARRPRTRADRIYLLLFAGTAGLVGLSVLWVVVTGLIARSELESVRHETRQLRSAVVRGDLTEARQLSARIITRSASAHQHTSGPAWWVAANLPLVGTPFRTGRVITTQTHTVSQVALPGVIKLAQGLQTKNLSDVGADLRLIDDAGPALHRAATVIRTARSTIAAQPGSWLPTVSSGRRSAVRSLTRVTGEVDGAGRAVDVLGPMLGSRRPQRYFLGFLNEAEARSLGGLPGAYAIFTVDRGRVHFTHFGSDDDLLGTRAKVSVTPEFTSLYGQDDPTGDIRNSDVSPDFPDAARIWAGMWQAKSGQHIDGAMAVDPSAIAFLLAVTGPATLSDGSQVNAANVVSLTQEQQYTLYGSASPADTRKRKTYLTNIAQAVAGRLLAAPNLRGLASPARKAVDQRRLVLWSANATYERNLAALGVAGTLTAPRGRAFSSFFLNNAAGGKMDLYLDRTMTYARASCRGRVTAVATLTLHNDTPNYPLPPYVTTVLGRKPAGAKPGFTRVVLAYYATPGAVIGSVTVDGSPVSVALTPELGLPTARLQVDLPAGATRVVRVAVREPVTHGPVTVLRQPGVRDIRVSTRMPSCS